MNNQEEEKSFPPYIPKTGKEAKSLTANATLLLAKQYIEKRAAEILSAADAAVAAAKTARHSALLEIRKLNKLSAAIDLAIDEEMAIMIEKEQKNIAAWEVKGSSEMMAENNCADLLILEQA